MSMSMLYMCNTINYLQCKLLSLELVANGTCFIPQFGEVGANRSTAVHSTGGRPMESAPKGASMCGG